MVRLFAALGVAFAVTLGLFFLMHSLIEMGKVELDDDKRIRVIDFVRMKRDAKVMTKKRELPKKQKLEAQPAPPSLNLPKSAPGPSAQAIRIEAPPPTIDKNVKLAGGPTLGSTAPSDAGSIPLVRIQPMYPRSAAEKRIEGWVEMEFTITTTGAVKNARVISSQPPNIFDRSALRAIRKWKYKPTIVDGVAIETKGVRVRLTFKLDQE